MKYKLLLSQYSTGHVLNVDGKSIFHSQNDDNSDLPYIGDFPNLHNAEKEAMVIVQDSPGIEVSLYTEKEQWIKTIRGNFETPIIIKDKWWKIW
jgi:hypothetical protein